MNTRVPSVPLITSDPYFSVWSPADHLYDADTVHWTGRTKRITGTAKIDGTLYRFMGLGNARVLEQTCLEISATSSSYTFEGAGIKLAVSFLSPLLLFDLDLLSKPVSCIGIKVSSTDGKIHNTEINFSFSTSLCMNTLDPAPCISGIHMLGNCEAAWTGKKIQGPLSHSGDDITIDWGYLYVAVPFGMGHAFVNNSRQGEDISAKLDFSGQEGESFFIVAYDDVASINYFGEIRKGYWARDGKTIIAAIEESINDYRAVKQRCTVFDQELNKKALAAGGPDYQLILNLAYRQTIAAHKLITDENGEIVFISKECFSNGCAATVDVSYPSIPLYLLYNPELVKGMLRPVLRFAGLPVWNFNFAPHDAGRFPHVIGQVYGLKNSRMKNHETYPPFYAFPANSDLYDLKFQMPVEECGNMLIMMAAIAKAEGNAEFSRPYQGLAKKWVQYLAEFGANPGEQLCTDDFAGHLASNCNLSAKAICGQTAYAMLLEQWGKPEEAAQYRKMAKLSADEWKRTAARGDHTALVFDRDSSAKGSAENGWSLKYNLIWDRIFGSGLFDENFFKSEIQWYLKKMNRYGVPLDSRREYTKSDWILWTAAFTNDIAEREALIAPVAGFLRESQSRAPFSDWYDTVSGYCHNFRNRTVQGGLFMPLLADAWRNG